MVSSRSQVMVLFENSNVKTQVNGLVRQKDSGNMDHMKAEK